MGRWLRIVSAFALLLFSVSIAPRAWSQGGESRPIPLFVPTLLVAHSLTDGSCAISELLPSTGLLLKRFGPLSSPCVPGTGEFRAHLATSGGFVYRSNGVSLNTISQFSSTGTLVGTITPNSSTTHKILPVARDFANSSIYIVDVFGGSNVIWHLDDPSTGVSSPFVTLGYPGVAGILDLYFSGAAVPGGPALFALTQTAPLNVFGSCSVPACADRVAKIDSTGAVQYFDNPNLVTPFIVDLGSLAVDPSNGNIYVATSNASPGFVSQVVELTASGVLLGTFPIGDVKPTIDVDLAGNIYVGRFSSTTGEISVYLPTGSLVRTINVPGATSIFSVRITRLPNF